jgi:carbonic anhydrase
MFDLIYRFDPTRPDLHKSPADAEEARQVLVDGNREFAEITGSAKTEKATRIIPFDPRGFGSDLAPGDAPLQAPFAAILGCSDARVPIEMVFGKGCNELFVVRVAGNVLGNECLGSLRYAVHQFPSSLKLVVVLAHARCGAVTEAVNVYLEPSRYIALATDPALRSIEDQILVAVRVVAITIEKLYGFDVARNPGYRNALIEAAVVMNAAWSAYCLRQEFLADSRKLGIAFGAYDLLSRRVRLPLSPPGQVSDEETGLFAPPEDADGFRELARRICGGKLVETLLSQTSPAA